jgi:hypothetical protein
MTPVYSRSDLLEVIHPTEVIRAVEEGFVAYSRGEVVVPPVGHLKFEHPESGIALRICAPRPARGRKVLSPDEGRLHRQS